MSDNQYQDYGGEYDQYGYDDNNYGNENQMELQQQEDYETKVELEYFEAQEMLRKGNVQQCLQNLQKLYQLSIQHNLRNWKPKILNMQLQIYSREQNKQSIIQTLKTISQLNKKQKYTQSSIKSIIMTMKQLNKEIFDFVKQKLYQFIQELDDMNRVRSLLMLVERLVEEGEYVEGREMVEKVEGVRRGLAVAMRRGGYGNININNKGSNDNINNFNIITTTTSSPSIATTFPPSLLIELYSHQITLSKHLQPQQNNTSSLNQLITRIHLTLPQLQSQSYLSDGHISIIKQSIAEIKYQQQNYLQCSKMLCQAFQQQMKYGKDHDKKKLLLKINVLVSLLTEDKQIYMKDKHNALYHQSASSFKSQNDIQSLYGLVEAFNNGDYVQFLQQLKTVNYSSQYTQNQNQNQKDKQSSTTTPYTNLVQKVITLIKSNKLLEIIKPYNKIKFSYLSRRLNCGQQIIREIVYRLIMDGKVDGRIKSCEGEEKKDSCLVINESNKDEYLIGQLENVKGLVGKFS